MELASLGQAPLPIPVPHPRPSPPCHGPRSPLRGAPRGGRANRLWVAAPGRSQTAHRSPTLTRGRVRLRLPTNLQPWRQYRGNARLGARDSAAALWRICPGGPADHAACHPRGDPGNRRASRAAAHGCGRGLRSLRSQHGSGGAKAHCHLGAFTPPPDDQKGEAMEGGGWAGVLLNCHPNPNPGRLSTPGACAHRCGACGAAEKRTARALPPGPMSSPLPFIPRRALNISSAGGDPPNGPMQQGQRAAAPCQGPRSGPKFRPYSVRPALHPRCTAPRGSRNCGPAGVGAKRQPQLLPKPLPVGRNKELSIPSISLPS